MRHTQSMPKNTGYLPPSWRSALWVEYRLTERTLLESFKHLPQELQDECASLWPHQEPDPAKIGRLAELHQIAEAARKKAA
jgi:hypothetical protein